MTAEDPAVAYLNRVYADQNPYKEGFSSDGDDALHYVEAGTGHTIIFVHGFPSFWFGWFKQMEALRHAYRVIAIDAPGANLSRRPPGWNGYSVESLAKRLGRFIEDVSPDEKITLIGHDWGGTLVWAYAEYDASKLDNLVVLSAPPYSLFIELAATDPQQQERSEYMPRIIGMDRKTLDDSNFPAALHARSYGELAKRGVLTDEQSQLFANALTLDAIDSGIEWYRVNMPPFDRIDLSHQCWPSRQACADVPVLLIEGELDKTFVDNLDQRARSHAHSLDHVQLAGVGHWTPLEGAEKVSNALLDLLEGRRG